MKIIQITCDKCDGKGKINKPKQTSNVCPKCNNKNFTIKNSEITLNIPRGTEKSYSQVYKNVMKDGDLQINVGIHWGKNYKMFNNNLTYEMNINFIDSIFGKNVSIYHPSGINIDFNTSKNGDIIHNDKTLILKGKGMNTMKDLYIIFKVTYPKVKQKMDLDSIKEQLSNIFLP